MPDKQKQESKHIKQSLNTLSRVLIALAKKPRKKEAYVPYTGSTLTRLLEGSLGGESSTCFIFCVDPYDKVIMHSLEVLPTAVTCALRPSIGLGQPFGRGTQMLCHSLILVRGCAAVGLMQTAARVIRVVAHAQEGTKATLAQLRIVRQLQQNPKQTRPERTSLPGSNAVLSRRAIAEQKKVSKQLKLQQEEVRAALAKLDREQQVLLVEAAGLKRATEQAQENEQLALQKAEQEEKLRRVTEVSCLEARETYSLSVQR